ncbi:MAG: ribosomal-protein-alanine N-acetyltransferase [Ruminococcaceae bacterium]|nr:ribosomal-protein-alanine N-acetyltransferase [Oscillospiraceae bacterium]
MRIERLSREHIDAVAALEARCFSEPWSAHALLRLVEGDGIGLVALTDGGELMAYVGALLVLDEAQITNVATQEEHRRRGAATALLAVLTEVVEQRGVRELSLEVRESNLSAISLYRRAGFAVAGRRPGFYTHPREAALVMLHRLGED